MFTRTSPWIVTLNVLNQSADVLHRLAELPELEHRRYELTEILQMYGARIERQLNSFVEGSWRTYCDVAVGRANHSERSPA
jgi:hypothetical protein